MPRQRTFGLKFARLILDLRREVSSTPQTRVQHGYARVWEGMGRFRYDYPELEAFVLNVHLSSQVGVNTGATVTERTVGKTDGGWKFSRSQGQHEKIPPTLCPGYTITFTRGRQYISTMPPSVI